MANIKLSNYSRIAYQIDNIYIPPEPVKPNAPVTRAAWSCANLPAGLTLSPSGELSGRPTVEGTYACDFKVETNWGTATKTINIKIQ